MKSLTDVIKEKERCDKYPNCHLCFLHSGDTCSWIRDALHYLEEYRTTRTAYIKAMADIEDNPPLTWEELKQMTGKPVWLEYCKTVTDEMDGHRWVILHTAYEEDDDGEEEIFCNDMCRLLKKWQGTRWQAFRKERE